MHTNDCQCGTQTLDRGAIERPRFFPRQLVTPDDLTLGQDYLRNKIRRHNRYLHGWGVVCGARVALPQKADPWKVIVKSGYILGPYGDEIAIERDICFDVRTRCMTATSGDACSDAVDGGCGEYVLDPRKAGTPFYVAVRYRDVQSRPVRVQPVGCGCDDSHCEFSRYSDGYELCVLDRCPASHQGEPPSFEAWMENYDTSTCPPCPSDPWVVLARVVTDEKGTIATIDNCSCRREVLSLATFWMRCAEAQEGGNADNRAVVREPVR